MTHKVPWNINKFSLRYVIFKVLFWVILSVEGGSYDRMEPCDQSLPLYRFGNAFSFSSSIRNGSTSAAAVVVTVVVVISFL